MGAVYRHCEGLSYRVLQLVPDATGYETTRSVQGSTVIYEQLENGKFPAGTVWARSEADFLGQTMVEGKPKETFELLTDPDDNAVTLKASLRTR